MTQTLAPGQIAETGFADSGVKLPSQDASTMRDDVRKLQPRTTAPDRIAALPPTGIQPKGNRTAEGLNPGCPTAAEVKNSLSKVLNNELWGRVTRAGLRGQPEVERIVDRLMKVCRPKAGETPEAWMEDPNELSQLLQDARSLSKLTGQRLLEKRLDRPEWNDRRKIPSAMTIDQVAELCYAVGFRGQHLAEAIAISRYESEGWQPRCNTRSHVEDSRGLFQMNFLVHRHYDGQKLFQPAYNARVAYEMSGGGKNWRPWTVFTQGTYRHSMKAATEAAQRLETEMKARRQMARLDVEPLQLAIAAKPR